MRRPRASNTPPAPVAVVSLVPEGVWTTMTEAPVTGWPPEVTVPCTADVVSWAWTAEAMAIVRTDSATPPASFFIDIFNYPLSPWVSVAFAPTASTRSVQFVRTI